MFFRKLLLVLCVCVFEYEASKILAAIPFPSISHQVVFRPLFRELAKKGHEVTVITTDPEFEKGKSPANLTEIDIHDVSYSMWQEILKTSRGNSEDQITQVEFILKMLIRMTEEQLNTEELKKLIHDKNQHFDLLFVESNMYSWLILSHFFKAPVILLSTMAGVVGNNQNIGAAIHWLLYPEPTNTKVLNLNIFEKFEVGSYTYRLNGVLDRVDTEINEMFRRNFDDVPELSRLKDNVDMLFVNIHPLWDANRPVPPSVIHVGGMHVKPPKELPKDLKNYLDSSKQGVVYFSFGTNVKPSLLPPEKIEIMFAALSKLPYNVLVKWDKENLPGVSDNIRVSKWYPQGDVLRHPNVKVFVTQGGLQSTQESITAGVPFVGIPMFTDQWYNTEMYVKYQIGVKLDLGTLTEEVFKEAIKKVVDDPIYRQNIKKFSEIYVDQPMPPLERAVWWTEHILRHGGGAHLRAPGANMSATQYYELELIAALALCFLLVAGAAVTVVLVIYKYAMRLVFGGAKVKLN